MRIIRENENFLSVAETFAFLELSNPESSRLWIFFGKFMIESSLLCNVLGVF